MSLPAKSAPSKRNSKYTALKQKPSPRGTGTAKRPLGWGRINKEEEEMQAEL